MALGAVKLLNETKVELNMSKALVKWIDLIFQPSNFHEELKKNMNHARNNYYLN